MRFTFLQLVLFVSLVGESNAQDIYRYKTDLSQVNNDLLQVELTVPRISSQDIIFYIPKIVPGTYVNSNFGKFISALKAFDKQGKELTVTMLPDSNSWRISKAYKLSRLTYRVEDTWDTRLKHTVYEMGGTNFEEGKNFLINTFGIFGYFEGMKKLPFEVEYTRPAGFYASTALKPVLSTQTADVFRSDNIDHFYDSPIMYCKPDTTTVKVGNSDVLISVYSPKKQITSAYIAQNINRLLQATKNYLGGKLPVDRYAFLYYFNSEQPTVQGQGALEHSYSSVYCLPELPQEQYIKNLVDISSHEFFHIVTPLNMCSKEIREFEFNKTVLSKHLWLYEGSTEYDAHHTQVTQGMISPEEYLQRLSQKIKTSKGFFNDTLPFTVMSKDCAETYASQFNNVYQKGALISACLDIYLNKLSGAAYGLSHLKHDLSVRYGAADYFKDDDLFDEITRLTFPEVRQFFRDYVEGNTPIPYERFFGMAGVRYIPERESQAFTIGGFNAGVNDKGAVVVQGISRMNEFGKKMGYKQQDELLSLNGTAISPANFQELVAKFVETAREGEPVTMQVKRKNNEGKEEVVTLTAGAMKVLKKEVHLLEFGDPSADQLAVRKAWLNLPCKN